MIPAVIGMANTRINYDMLNYLPEDMDTIIGQNELMEDFGKGAFSFIIVEDITTFLPLKCYLHFCNQPCVVVALNAKVKVI